jgi:hypothetical protein
MPPSTIRCPYCVEGSGFKIMRAIAGGDWHECEICAHVVMPNDPEFRCTCQHCLALSPLRESSDLV